MFRESKRIVKKKFKSILGHRFYLLISFNMFKHMCVLGSSTVYLIPVVWDSIEKYESVWDYDLTMGIERTCSVSRVFQVHVGCTSDKSDMMQDIPFTGITAQTQSRVNL